MIEDEYLYHDLNRKNLNNHDAVMNKGPFTFFLIS